MKVLYLHYNVHNKNNIAIRNYKNIEVTTINSIDELNNHDLSNFDCVLSISVPIDVSKYPNTKFIFGPQFSVFPDERLSLIKGKNAVYNLLSDWVINIWSKSDIADGVNFIKLPFGVDTNKFNEIKQLKQRNKVFIYYKSRNPDELYFVINYLNSINIECTVFSYNSKYHEIDYINFLHESKFGIWIGTHESQGFALQEALSCNVPLLVWNVRSMNQEYGCNYTDIPATTIPYWDERCGEYFYDSNNFEHIFNKFIFNIENYRPREYILEKLSMKICENKLIDTINNINI
jgi:hypothetical protein